MPSPAPVMSHEEAVLPVDGRKMACLYVVVDSRSRSDVADFMQTWHKCCDLAGFDWQTVRRPSAALVSIELRHCCDDEHAPSMRLVFDADRDRGALERLAATGMLVVGTRDWGRFGNAVVAYAVDGVAVRDAMADARMGLRQLAAAG